MAARFALDLGWRALLSALGVEPQDVLRHAGLPLDLFQRQSASVSAEDYLRLWQGLEAACNDPLLPLKLIEAMTPETFSPALFAGLCSDTLDEALMRLAEYKPLIGPMSLKVEKARGGTRVEVRGLPGGRHPSASFVAAELLFFVHLARLGTRDRIVPLTVTSPLPLSSADVLTDWFGVRPVSGDVAGLIFSAEDAERPFLTASPAMWAAFHPTLRQRLVDAVADAGMTDRVRGWINQSVASGRVSIDLAAKDLGVSTRSLQRKLSEEGTSFQAELATIRQGLARHYLTTTHFSIAEIAFLLGYGEQNSFFRAFHDWTGATPDAVRSGRVILQ